MGADKSKVKSNISKIETCPNSGKEIYNLEKMNFKDENKDKIIKRAWIVRRSIYTNDRHIKLFDWKLFMIDIARFYKDKFNNIDLIKPKKNVFEIKNESKFHFKHWALILELSNGVYVNIQFGITGFSLKEFNKTGIEGENLFNSILETWGKETHPISFCYLGELNYPYDNLKDYLNKIKKKEEVYFNKKKKTYYHSVFYNCQHFICDIEKQLLGDIYAWHPFNYYLDEFFMTFFPQVDLVKIKKKYETYIDQENLKLFKKNKDNIDNKMIKVAEIENDYTKIDFYKHYKKAIKKLEKLYSRKITDLK